MAEHTMVLDDQIHRTIFLDENLSGDDRFSVVIVCRELASGDLGHFIQLKSNAGLFQEVEFKAKRVKIPPDLLEE